MLKVPPDTRIFMAVTPVNMRRSFSGLCAIIADAERCMRAVAVGRKAFLFVGSERAGHAAAIYYSLVE
jgi:hypothetical protein